MLALLYFNSIKSYIKIDPYTRTDSSEFRGNRERWVPPFSCDIDHLIACLLPNLPIQSTTQPILQLKSGERELFIADLDG